MSPSLCFCNPVLFHLHNVDVVLLICYVVIPMLIAVRIVHLHQVLNFAGQAALTATHLPHAEPTPTVHILCHFSILHIDERRHFKQIAHKLVNF